MGVWTCFKRVLRYIKRTREIELAYTGSRGALEVEGFCDADWAGYKQDRNWASGYVTTISGAAVSWKSKKQPALTTSTAEAEFLVLRSLALEGLVTCSPNYFCNRHGEGFSDSTQR